MNELTNRTYNIGFTYSQAMAVFVEDFKKDIGLSADFRVGGALARVGGEID